jgi:hypothetical protein
MSKMAAKIQDGMLAIGHVPHGGWQNPQRRPLATENWQLVRDTLAACSCASCVVEDVPMIRKLVGKQHEVVNRTLNGSSSGPSKPTTQTSPSASQQASVTPTTSTSAKNPSTTVKIQFHSLHTSPPSDPSESLHTFVAPRLSISAITLTNRCADRDSQQLVADLCYNSSSINTNEFIYRFVHKQ